jgi:calcium-dependent protein kinase
LAPLDSVKLHPGQFIQRFDGSFYQHYDVIRVLGEGSYGKVYLVQHQTTRQLRAVKVISKVEHVHADESLVTELQAIAKLDHPHILKLYELYVSLQSIAIVSEYLSGGELFDHLVRLGRITEQETASIMRQVLSAISHCHQHSVVHRDLKPENLMLEKPYREGEDVNIKVIDFGASSLLSPEKLLEKKTGTSLYVAPEVLIGSYNEKCDVWSCGVILYMLLAGFPPFNGHSVREILTNVRKAKVSFKHSVFQTVSKRAKTLIKRMLTKNPAARISSEEALHDTWIERHHSLTLRLEVAPVSLDNLRHFHAGVKLQQAVMAFIATQMLNTSQTECIKATFEQLDLDGDGRLSKKELLHAYSRVTSEAQAIYIVESLMQEVDADKNGFIDYTEFLTAGSNVRLLLTKGNIKAAFQTFDKDESGKISVAELKAALDSSGSLDNALWTGLIREADRNADGEIDLDEFLALMFSSLTPQLS